MKELWQHCMDFHREEIRNAEDSQEMREDPIHEQEDRDQTEDAHVLAEVQPVMQQKPVQPQVKLTHRPGSEHLQIVKLTPHEVQQTNSPVESRQLGLSNYQAAQVIKLANQGNVQVTENEDVQKGLNQEQNLVVVAEDQPRQQQPQNQQQPPPDVQQPLFPKEAITVNGQQIQTIRVIPRINQQKPVKTIVTRPIVTAKSESKQESDGQYSQYNVQSEHSYVLGRVKAAKRTIQAPEGNVNLERSYEICREVVKKSANRNIIEEKICKKLSPTSNINYQAQNCSKVDITTTANIPTGTAAAPTVILAPPMSSMVHNFAGNSALGQQQVPIILPPSVQMPQQTLVFQALPQQPNILIQQPTIQITEPRIQIQHPTIQIQQPSIQPSTDQVDQPKIRVLQANQNQQTLQENIEQLQDNIYENSSLDDTVITEDGPSKSMEQGIPPEIKCLLPTVPLPPHTEPTTEIRQSYNTKCEKCNWVTHLPVEMDKHVLKVHKLISNPFKCPECPYEYSAERLLKWHMEETHKIIWCVQCNKWPCNCANTEAVPGDNEIVKEFVNSSHTAKVVSKDNGNRIVQDVPQVTSIEQFKCERCMVEFSSLEEMADISNHDEEWCGELYSKVAYTHDALGVEGGVSKKQMLSFFEIFTLNYLPH